MGLMLQPARPVYVGKTACAEQALAPPALPVEESEVEPDGDGDAETGNGQASDG